METNHDNGSEQQLALVRKLLTVSDSLPRSIFNDAEDLLPEVADKLLEIIEFIKRELLSPIQNYKILDVILCGQMCGYIYDEKTELDLAIILDDFTGDNAVFQHILTYFNLSLVGRGFRFSIYGHNVNYFFVSKKELEDSNSYSLINRCWLKKPIRREFGFSPEFCFKRCCELSAEIHRIVASLPRVDKKFLTSESCDILGQYLDLLYRTSMNFKRYHPEHEYCLDYNVFRCLQVFGTWPHFRKFVHDSRYHLIKGANPDDK